MIKKVVSEMRSSKLCILLPRIEQQNKINRVNGCL